MASRIADYIRILNEAENADRPLIDVFIDLFGAVDGRIAGIEGVATSIAELQTQLTEQGSQIVAASLDPVRAEIQKKADLGAIFVANSVTNMEIGTGVKTLTISPEASRLMFAPAYMLSVVSVDNPNAVMYGRKVSYNSDTGVLIFEAQVTSGSGGYSSWAVSPGALGAMARSTLGFVGLNVDASGNYGFGVTATAGDRINASIATTGVDDVAAYRGTASSTITADSATALSTGVSLTAAFDQNGFNASQAYGSVRGAAYGAVATGASGTVTNAIGSIAFVGNYGAGTVTNAMGYWTLPLNIAGGALTNYYGFRQPPTNQGSGTVIAFYPSIAARTGAWNFYSDGTANNAYLGKSRFGSVVAPVNTVDITGSFGRGAPVTKTANFTLAATENWIICNGSGSITVTLPAASSWTGREVTIKTITAQTVVSAASNVVPLAGGAAGTAILAATAGKWATLVSNGTNWIIMAGN